MRPLTWRLERSENCGFPSGGCMLFCRGPQGFAVCKYYSLLTWQSLTLTQIMTTIQHDAADIEHQFDVAAKIGGWL